MTFPPNGVESEQFGGKRPELLVGYGEQPISLLHVLLKDMVSNPTALNK